ncbi:tetratricopeptide repeat protein [Dactylosporangium sp. NPDC049140]|uniref:tetratricopeptide repeat protein n=1 Tax=Dactylosporangium sp. NPDC049140 TaxID=3155647 RepID=UPI0033EB23FB
MSNHEVGSIHVHAPGQQIGDHNVQHNHFRDTGPAYALVRHAEFAGRGAGAEEPGWLRRQPSRLLDARNGIVPFQGRESELDQLAAWRDDDVPERHLLVHAYGGHGKTRLAAHFAGLCTELNWTVWHARQGPVTVERPAHGTADGAGLLLIVDYADRWNHTDLVRLFADPQLQHGRLRVLLLGRGAGWWPSMRGELAETRHTVATDLRLGPLAPTAADRLEVFAAARDRFAAADLYDIAEPRRVAAPGALEHAGFGLVLTVHMAALVAVDAAARGHRPPEDPHGLSAYLLDREFVSWQRHYQSGLKDREYKTPPTVMGKAVFVAVLTGAMPHVAGERVLTRFGLEVHPHRILADHRTCYPPVDRALVFEPLYPDRLAEDLLALLLPGHSISAYDPDPWSVDVPAALLARVQGGAPGFTARTVTFLAAAADRWPHVGPRMLYPLLLADPRLALDAGAAALTALAEIDADRPLRDDHLAVLEAVEAILPQGRDVDLDAGIATLCARLTAHRLALTDDPLERGQLYERLSTRFWRAGRNDEALAAGREATAIARTLSAMDSELFGSQLGFSLSNLGVQLSLTGRVGEALQTSARAVDMVRRAVGNDPLRLSADFALVLSNHAMRLRQAERLEEALAAAREAETAIRLAAAADGGGHDADLAAVLANLGVTLAAAGRPAESVVPTEESVSIRRALVRRDRAAFEPDLAAALSNLANQLCACGRAAEAVEPAQEAFDRTARLAAANPTAFDADLAARATNLANAFAGAGRHREALRASETSVEGARRLAAQNPAVFAPLLATALATLAIGLQDVGRPGESLAVTAEVVEMRTALAEDDPAVFRPALATALVNLGVGLATLGRATESVAALRHAIQLLRADSKGHELGLARALVQLCGSLWSAGMNAEAQAAGSESVAILRRLRLAAPGAHDKDLGQALGNLSIPRFALGAHDAAIADSTEAVGILRRSARNNPAGDEPQLAHALTNHAGLLAKHARHDEARASIDEALVLARRAVDRHAEAHQPELDRVLQMSAAIALAAEQIKPGTRVSGPAVPVSDPGVPVPDPAVPLPDTAVPDPPLLDQAVPDPAVPDPAAVIVMIERLVARREQTLGPDHPHTLVARQGLAQALLRAGEVERACVLLEQSLADHDRVFGRDHPDTLVARNNLGHALTTAGRPAEALPLLEANLAGLEQTVGADHPGILTALANIARAHNELGHPDRAATLMERAGTISQAAYGPDHEQTMMAHLLIGRFRYLAGDAAGALPAYERSLEDHVRVHGPEHPATIELRTELDTVRAAAS